MNSSSPQPIYKQQSSESGVVPAVGPAGLINFLIAKFPTMVGSLWPYMQAIWMIVTFTVANPIGGRTIFPDEFYKVIDSFGLRTPDLGQIYSKTSTKGAWFGYLAQIVSNGYRLPYKYTDPIAPDTLATRQIPIRIPLGHRVFSKGHQTAPWTGFFKDGVLEIATAAADVLGPNTEITDLRIAVYAEITPEPEARIHPMFVWRFYQSAAATNLNSIKMIGGGEGLNNVKPGCRHAALAFLCRSDGLAGSSFLGLGGTATINTIRNIEIPGRSQETLEVSAAPLNGVGQTFMRELDQRKDSLVDESAQWPIGFDTNGNALVDAANPATGALFLFAPSKGQEITKLQKHYGDFEVNFQFTGPTPPGTPLWISLEGFEYQEKGKEWFRERMGIPSNVGWRKKLASGKPDVSTKKAQVLPDKFNVPTTT